MIITKEKEKAELSKEYQDVCICVWWIFILNKVVKVGQIKKVTLKYPQTPRRQHRQTR